MQVNGVAFPGTDSPVGWFEWPTAGSVNGIAVFLKPLPHLFEPFDLKRLNLSIGFGSDIKQQVSIATGRTYQTLQTLLERLHCVIGFPGPLTGNGHTGLPGTIDLKAADPLFWRIKISLGTCAVVDDDIRLNGVCKIDDTLSADGIKSLRNIEPQHIKGTIIQQKFGHLFFEVGSVGIEVVNRSGYCAARACQRKIRMVPVGRGIVGSKCDSLLFAGLGQFFYYILMKW